MNERITTRDGVGIACEQTIRDSGGNEDALIKQTAFRSRRNPRTKHPSRGDFTSIIHVSHIRAALPQHEITRDRAVTPVEQRLHGVGVMLRKRAIKRVSVRVGQPQQARERDFVIENARAVPQPVADLVRDGGEEDAVVGVGEVRFRGQRGWRARVSREIMRAGARGAYPREGVGREVARRVVRAARDVREEYGGVQLLRGRKEIQDCGEGDERWQDGLERRHRRSGRRWGRGRMGVR